jgi:putative heme-binding domain-containing protein
MPLIAGATRSEDLLHYLFFLRTVSDSWNPERRRAYFEALNRAEKFEGARDYQRSIRMIRSEVLETLSPAEQEIVAPLVAESAANANGPLSSGPQRAVTEWKLEDLAPELDRVGKSRSFEGGRQAFSDAQCILCHRIGNAGGLVGPDLTAVAGRFSRRDILDSIVNPSHVIDDKYRNSVFVLKNGAQVVGSIEREDADRIRVRTSPLLPQTIPVEKKEIVRRELSSISPMPPGLINILTKEQVLDLLAFIEAGGNREHRDFSK